MGLPTGCTRTADEAFKNKHSLAGVTTTLHEGMVTLSKNNNIKVTLCKVYGDCTAATLYTQGCPSNGDLIAFIPTIREYLSLNARINCYGTRLIKGFGATQAFIKDLIKQHVIISNVQLGNRNKRDDEYQISYNIIVPNPVISGYTNGGSEDVPNIEAIDVEKIKHMRKQFGLYIKQGKLL